MPQNLLNPKNNTAAELAEWIKCHEDIGVVCHVSPDGDTLGSGLEVWFDVAAVVYDRGSMTVNYFAGAFIPIYT